MRGKRASTRRSLPTIDSIGDYRFPPTMDIEAAKAWLEANEHWLVPLGALAAIGTPVVAFFWRNIVGGIARLWRHRPRITFGNRGHNIPKTRLTFVLVERRSFWHMGRAGDAPSTQVATDWYVTNVSRGSVRILAARFERPRAAETDQRLVLVSDPDEPHAVAPENVLISTGATVTLHLHSMMTPPPKHRPGEPIKVRAVVVDQYQHEHRTPLVSVPNQ